MKRREYLTGLAVMALAGCTARGSGSAGADVGGEGGITVERETPMQTGADRVFKTTDSIHVISAREYAEDEYNQGVRGTLKNAAETPLEFVHTDAYFYDASGTRISEAVDSTTNLTPGEKWEFDIAFHGDDWSRVDSWRVVIDAT